jgi:hypothetical protein
LGRRPLNLIAGIDRPLPGRSWAGTDLAQLSRALCPVAERPRRVHLPVQPDPRPTALANVELPLLPPAVGEGAKRVGPGPPQGGRPGRPRASLSAPARRLSKGSPSRGRSSEILILVADEPDGRPDAKSADEILACWSPSTVTSRRPRMVTHDPRPPSFSHVQKHSKRASAGAAEVPPYVLSHLRRSWINRRAPSWPCRCASSSSAR